MKIIFFSIITILLTLSSCESYEDYTGDYTYSAVYFGTQKPLRTVVARNPQMSFKFGVTLGGKLNNTKDETVGYSIDTSLLRTVAAGRFELLPEEYYTLSDNSGIFTIPAGKIIGDITLTLDRDLFCNDPKALKGEYALPLMLDSTSSADSVLIGSDAVAPKNYTVIVVKYVSPYSGTYYRRGSQSVSSGDTITYNESDLSQNQTCNFSTINYDTVSFSTSTNFEGAIISKDYVLVINENNTVRLQDDTGKTFDGTWDWTNKDKYLMEIKLNYDYTHDSKTFQVSESYTLRRAIEEDLRFATW